MLVPLVLISLATLAAAIMAYGTHPAWAQYQQGLELIQAARHYQWPLVAISLLLSLALMVLVVIGRKRAWWLIGLAPLLALFAHRFVTGPMHSYAVLDSPRFVNVADASFLADDDWVVGVQFSGRSFAFPYAGLYCTPAVISADYDKRMLLMWSAFANRCMAVQITREIKARDLEIVSMPANSLLLYNVRLGQFINGVTGQTMQGQQPVGFGAALPTSKTTWRQWRKAHPESIVMVPARIAKAASAPLLPYHKMPPVPEGIAPGTMVVMVATTQPVAIPSEAISASPMNVPPGDLPMLLYRDPESGLVRAFDRRVDDLAPRFTRNEDAARKGVMFVDADTGSGWNSTGSAIDGPLAKTKKLNRITQFEDGLYWGVMKFWYPGLQLYDPGIAGIKAAAHP